MQRAGREQEQLRFDAVDARGVLEEFNEVVEQGVADGIVEALGLVEGVEVADDGLGGLEDAKSISTDDAVAQGDVAGKDAAVEVFKDHVGSACVVPVQAALPALGLVAQQRPQLRR
jgi:hypothetical protein